MFQLIGCSILISLINTNSLRLIALNTFSIHITFHYLAFCTDSTIHYFVFTQLKHVKYINSSESNFRQCQQTVVNRIYGHTHTAYLCVTSSSKVEIDTKPHTSTRTQMLNYCIDSTTTNVFQSRPYIDRNDNLTQVSHSKQARINSAFASDGMSLYRYKQHTYTWAQQTIKSHASRATHSIPPFRFHRHLYNTLTCIQYTVKTLTVLHVRHYKHQCIERLTQIFSLSCAIHIIFWWFGDKNNQQKLYIHKSTKCSVAGNKKTNL